MITTVGLDIAKSIFQAYGISAIGEMLSCNPGYMITVSFKMNVTPSTSKPYVSPYLGKELIGISGYSGLPCHAYQRGRK